MIGNFPKVILVSIKKGWVIGRNSAFAPRKCTTPQVSHSEHSAQVFVYISHHFSAQNNLVVAALSRTKRTWQMVAWSTLRQWHNRWIEAAGSVVLAFPKLCLLVDRQKTYSLQPRSGPAGQLSAFLSISSANWHGETISCLALLI